MKLRQRRLYQQVAEILARRIQEGDFEAGRSLPSENDLAEEYGVSRNVMREALVALEILGLVSVRAGAGTFVNPRPQPIRISLATISATTGPSPMAVLEARKAFEGEVAFAAALNASAEEIEALQSLLNQVSAAPLDQLDVFDWPRSFHVGVARATRNPVFVSVVEAIWEAMSGPMFSGLRARVSLKQLDSHVKTRQRIIDGIRSHDAVSARAAMHDHIDMVIRDLFPKDTINPKKS